MRSFNSFCRLHVNTLTIYGKIDLTTQQVKVAMTNGMFQIVSYKGLDILHNIKYFGITYIMVMQNTG